MTGIGVELTPPPPLLANYVHSGDPSAKHSSASLCLNVNRASVNLPFGFGVMRLSTSAIFVRGRTLGDIHGRGCTIDDLDVVMSASIKLFGGTLLSEQPPRPNK